MIKYSLEMSKAETRSKDEFPENVKVFPTKTITTEDRRRGI